ncbi:unnamed protein product [Amoebophrya sp. A120]|nr:unnamed protein product [Amoebophrya sp. A120]|eukprot:GSA120T00006837001.1
MELIAKSKKRDIFDRPATSGPQLLPESSCGVLKRGKELFRGISQESRTSTRHQSQHRGRSQPAKKTSSTQPAKKTVRFAAWDEDRYRRAAPDGGLGELHNFLGTTAKKAAKMREVAHSTTTRPDVFVSSSGSAEAGGVAKSSTKAFANHEDQDFCTHADGGARGRASDGHNHDDETDEDSEEQGDAHFIPPPNCMKLMRILYQRGPTKAYGSTFHEDRHETYLSIMKENRELFSQQPKTKMENTFCADAEPSRKTNTEINATGIFTPHTGPPTLWCLTANAVRFLRKQQALLTAVERENKEKKSWTTVVKMGMMQKKVDSKAAPPAHPHFDSEINKAAAAAPSASALTSSPATLGCLSSKSSLVSPNSSSAKSSFWDTKEGRGVFCRCLREFCVARRANRISADHTGRSSSRKQGSSDSFGEFNDYSAKQEVGVSLSQFCDSLEFRALTDKYGALSPASVAACASHFPDAFRVVDGKNGVEQIFLAEGCARPGRRSPATATTLADWPGTDALKAAVRTFLLQKPGNKLATVNSLGNSREVQDSVVRKFGPPPGGLLQALQTLAEEQIHGSSPFTVFREMGGKNRYFVELKQQRQNKREKSMIRPKAGRSCSKIGNETSSQQDGGPKVIRYFNPAVLQKYYAVIEEIIIERCSLFPPAGRVEMKNGRVGTTPCSATSRDIVSDSRYVQLQKLHQPYCVTLRAILRSCPDQRFLFPRAGSASPNEQGKMLFPGNTAASGKPLDVYDVGLNPNYKNHARTQTPRGRKILSGAAPETRHGRGFELSKSNVVSTPRSSLNSCLSSSFPHQNARTEHDTTTSSSARAGNSSDPAVDTGPKILGKMSTVVLNRHWDTIEQIIREVGESRCTTRTAHRNVTTSSCGRELIRRPEFFRVKCEVIASDVRYRQLKDLSYISVTLRGILRRCPPGRFQIIDRHQEQQSQSGDASSVNSTSRFPSKHDLSAGSYDVALHPEYLVQGQGSRKGK